MWRRDLSSETGERPHRVQLATCSYASSSYQPVKHRGGKRGEESEKEKNGCGQLSEHRQLALSHSLIAMRRLRSVPSWNGQCDLFGVYPEVVTNGGWSDWPSRVK